DCKTGFTEDAVAVFSEDSASVKSATFFNAALTDSRTSTSCQARIQMLATPVIQHSFNGWGLLENAFYHLQRSTAPSRTIL
ncbi:hypothetical protein AOLI_G00038010, partial [Acnodon oligacanthus]